MKRYGVYMRVSTDKQDVDSQRHALTQWLSEHPGEAIWYEDLHVSGTKDKRPAFLRMQDDVRNGRIDSVVTFRLDRISRNAVFAMKVLLDWIVNDIEFFATDQPILHLSKDNPLRLTIVALFAEIAQLEREALVSRTKAGLAAARARGVRLGGKIKVTAEQVERIRSLAATGLDASAISTRTAVPRTTVRRWLQRPL